MESIVKIIAIICGIGLPILIVWLNNRKKINETNQRTQIVLAAIEKNAETDVEDLLKKMAPMQKKTLLKEKLLTKLLWGSTITVLGVCFFIYALWIDCVGGSNPDLLHLIYFVGIILFGIGVVFLLNYFISKKMLAKEIEAEEKKLTAEANL